MIGNIMLVGKNKKSENWNLLKRPNLMWIWSFKKNDIKTAYY